METFRKENLHETHVDFQIDGQLCTTMPINPLISGEYVFKRITQPNSYCWLFEVSPQWQWVVTGIFAQVDPGAWASIEYRYNQSSGRFSGRALTTDAGRQLIRPLVFRERFPIRWAADPGRYVLYGFFYWNR